MATDRMKVPGARVWSDRRTCSTEVARGATKFLCSLARAEW